MQLRAFVLWAAGTQIVDHDDRGRPLPGSRNDDVRSRHREHLAGLRHLGAGTAEVGLSKFMRFPMSVDNRDILFTVHDLCAILPPTQEDGPGVYNQTSADIGYAWKDGNASAGPSVAFYVMPACGASLCGRVGGLAVGGHAQTNAYVAGPLGVSVSLNVDWIGGGSLVLPGHVSVVVVAAPVLRWSAK